MILLVIFTFAFVQCKSGGGPRSSYAFDPWDTTDKVLAGTLIVSNVMDWAQTRYLSRHPSSGRVSKHVYDKDGNLVYESHNYTWGGVENNPILGENPSTTKVDIYFPLWIIFQLGVAHVLPDAYNVKDDDSWIKKIPLRKAWLGGMTIWSIHTVVHNNSIGLEMRF